MAKQKTAAERIAEAFANRKKNPARSAAGKKGAAKASWNRHLGKANRTQGGNPYWGLTSPGASQGPVHFAGIKKGPSTTRAAFHSMTHPRKKVLGSIGKTVAAPSKWEKLLNRPEVKGLGAGLILSMLIGSIFNQVNESRQVDTEKQMLDAQLAGSNPELLYYRNLLPRAQEQEQAMLGALMGKLSSGGVLGPALAKGEYNIGG